MRSPARAFVEQVPRVAVTCRAHVVYCDRYAIHLSVVLTCLLPLACSLAGKVEAGSGGNRQSAVVAFEVDFSRGQIIIAG